MLSVSNISFDSILWFCASGKAFFAGAILLAATGLIHTIVKRKRWLAGIYFLYTISILAIILSATPLSLIFYCFWTAAFVVSLLLRKNHPRLGVVLLMTGSFIAIGIVVLYNFIFVL